MNKNQLFSKLVLPVRPMQDVDGAKVLLLSDEVAVEEAVREPFFGGYAEDFLADLGFDMIEEVAEKAPKIKRV